jgi:hypothetical protein
LLEQTKRKEVTIMKIATSFLAGLLLIGTLGATATAMAADGVISKQKLPPGVIYKQELTPGSYCHLKFPAIREETLSSDHPVLLDPSDGDVIDYYGSCDEDPLGKDQVHERKLDAYHRWANDYED